MPTVAIIGASTNPAKFGHRSVVAHRRAGYEVYPVHPTAQEIEGLRAYARVGEIPAELDRVSMYVPPELGLTLLPEIAEKGCEELFLNPGSESPELVAAAEALGLRTIQACSILDVAR